MKMDREQIKSIIEALLFTWGDPLSIKDIADVIELDYKETEEILDEMLSEFDYELRGLQITKIGDAYQIGTRAELFPWIEKLNKPIGSRSLSNAALETLSIIAYKQPVIKSDIEAIRGVKCDTAIYTLLDKDMIEEKGRMDRIGRPIIYGTTDTFLKTFGLESLDKLPELKESLVFEEIVEKEVKEQFSDIELSEDE